MDECQRCGREDDLGAKVRGHCPADYPPAERINHHGEVKVAGPRGDVGYAGHLQAIWDLPWKFAFGLVRPGMGATVADRSAERSPADHPNQPALGSIGPVSGRGWSRVPRFVAPGGDSHYPAHRGDVVHGLIRLKNLGGTGPLSRTNQAVAFQRASRSSRSCWFSRPSRTNFWRSSLVRLSVRRPSSRSACRTHLGIAAARTSNSRASSPGMRPVNTNSMTRSRPQADRGRGFRASWIRPGRRIGYPENRAILQDCEGAPQWRRSFALEGIDANAGA